MILGDLDLDRDLELDEYLKLENEKNISKRYKIKCPECSNIVWQECSQAEARKPGIQHHIGLDTNSPDFVACKQQRGRPACASTQTGQRLCYSLSEQQSN